MDDNARVLACGHPPSEHGPATTGYAILTAVYFHNGRILRPDDRICYGCSDALQRHDIASAEPGGQFTGYVSSDWRKVTSWTGGVLMDVLSVGEPHPWSGYLSRSSDGRRWVRKEARCYFQALDAAGRVWSGTGYPGMWASLRLTRQTV